MIILKGFSEDKSNWRLLFCGRICGKQHLHKEIRFNFSTAFCSQKNIAKAKLSSASVFFCEWFKDMISRRQLEYHLEEVLHVRRSSCDLLSTLWAKLLVEAKPGERKSKLSVSLMKTLTCKLRRYGVRWYSWISLLVVSSLQNKPLVKIV